MFNANLSNFSPLLNEGDAMVHAMEHKIWAGFIFSLYYMIFERYFAVLRVPFWPALLITILGAHFPDFDLDFGRRFHRSPITHSALIPAILFAYHILYILDKTSLVLMALFFLGYASHLLLDIFPANASILKRFTYIFRNYVPGDIRGIPKRYEKTFLVVSGVLCIVFAVVFLTVAAFTL